MNNDPGLFTDATGEGMAGSTDVSYSTQKQYKTIYNGSKACTGCGYTMAPFEALLSELCPSCTRRKQARSLKNRMSE